MNAVLYGQMEKVRWKLGEVVYSEQQTSIARGQFDHSRHYESAACTLGNAPLSELTYGQADKAVVS
jgi:hypothetical protein